MNKKFVIFIVIILLFSASISLATFLNYYVKIQAAAEVSPPEFYIGTLGEETLLINEKSPDCADFNIVATYRSFQTKNLGRVNFNYFPKVKFFVRAKVATTTVQDLIVNFGYIDNLASSHTICSETISITNTMNDYTTGFIGCSEAPSNVEHFYYEFKKGCENCDYTISKCGAGFYTKVKLSK